jgi:hypothetical protein
MTPFAIQKLSSHREDADLFGAVIDVVNLHFPVQISNGNDAIRACAAAPCADEREKRERAASAGSANGAVWGSHSPPKITAVQDQPAAESSRWDNPRHRKGKMEGRRSVHLRRPLPLKGGRDQAARGREAIQASTSS